MYITILATRLILIPAADIISAVIEYYPIFLPVLIRIVTVYTLRREYKYLYETLKYNIINDKHIPLMLWLWVLLDYLVWIGTVLITLFEINHVVVN